MLCRAAAVALDMDTAREGAAAGDLRHGGAEWRVALAANEFAGGTFASAQGLLAGQAEYTATDARWCVL